MPKITPSSDFITDMQIYESTVSELQAEKSDLEQHTKCLEDSSREQQVELSRQCEEQQQALASRNTCQQIELAHWSF